MRRLVMVLAVAACGKKPLPADSVDRALPAPAAALPAWNAAAEREGPNPCDGVHFEISSREKDGYTSFRGTLTHEGDGTVTLVLPGDGSEVGWRTPIVTWQVWTPAGAPVTLSHSGRCGNINALRPDEIFTLRPGERHDLGDWFGSPDVPPDTYVVRAIYENDPRREMRRTLERNDEALLARIRATTACRVASNAISVRLRGH
jgi:hypothetical protein